MQQDLRRPTLMRRIFFPYSGEDVLSGKQVLRVMLAWGLAFPLPMALCSLSVALIGSLSLQKTALITLLAFFSGVIIFGSLGWLIVIMNNRSAQISAKAAGCQG